MAEPGLTIHNAIRLTMDELSFDSCQLKDSD